MTLVWQPYLSVLVRDTAAGQPPARAVPHQQVARSVAGIVHELSRKDLQKRPRESKRSGQSGQWLTSSRVVTIASAAGASG